MKYTQKKPPAPDRLASVCVTLCLAAMAAGLLALYYATGYRPLLLAGLIQALPAAVHLLILKPARQKEYPEDLPEDLSERSGEPEKKRKRFWKKLVRLYKKADRKLDAWYCKARNGTVTVLIIAATVAVHLLFWKWKGFAVPEKLGFYVPVSLAALFVLSIVLEKWCKFAAGEQNPYTRALLRGLRSALAVGRAAQLLTAVTLVVQLLGFYDARSILQAVLAVLLVYETVFVAFSLAVRIIRHELNTAPEFLIPVPGLSGGDVHILQYLEENTGITMRSLWSMRLVKKVLPAAVLGVALLLWLSTGLVQIEAHQEGALYRLGDMLPQTLKPGIHMTLPWPFDQVEVYDTQTVKRITVGYVSTGDQDNLWTENHGTEEYRLLLGGGNELISINLQVEYRVSDLHSYVSNTASPETLLEDKAYQIITARTIVSDLDTMLSTDRQAFSESFRQELQEAIAPYGTGLTVENVVLESIHPPVEVADVFQRLIGAGIDAEQIVLLAQNEAYATVADANSQYVVKVGDAKVQKYQAVAAAQSAVAEFMAGVAADEAFPEAYRYYKYINAMTTAYSGAKLVIVGEGVDTGNLYLGSLTASSSDTGSEIGTEEEYPEDEYTYDEEY